MNGNRALALCLISSSLVLAQASRAQTLQEQNERLFQKMKSELELSDPQLKNLKDIFSKRGFMGQGNPAVTTRPMTPQECKDRRAKAGLKDKDEANMKICGAPYMAPMFNSATQKPEDAKSCIDQYEFPNIPCEYPVVWTKTMEAAQVCEAMGKRLCDAHEWEGACEGSLTPPDYPFELAKGVGMNEGVRRMRAAHNAKYAGSKSWSYGPNFKKGVCAQNSTKDAKCAGGGWKDCGSNHYPVGSFPECQSKLGVFDLNGNAAEHMNLPLAADQMASTGSKKLGVTEMKGSWFIWDKYQAHEDWCRWRAPFWHGSRVMDVQSHENYHLGFRCCKTLGSK